MLSGSRCSLTRLPRSLAALACAAALAACGGGTTGDDPDGNVTDGDGCSADCQSREICGNNIVDASELCDDGNVVDGDGCSADCGSDESCGNGIIDTALGEQCDDATANSDVLADACRSDCQLARCGDGVLDAAEECDDGNAIDGDGCSTGCLAGTCVTWQSGELACVYIDFPTGQATTFSVAQAQAGVTFGYRLVVPETVDDIKVPHQDWGCCGGAFLERVTGGGYTYCLCDMGLCNPVGCDYALITPQNYLQGQYPYSFDWSGMDWFGPSDTMPSPPQTPFPPGNYEVVVSQFGQWLDPIQSAWVPYSISASLPISLSP